MRPDSASNKWSTIMKKLKTQMDFVRYIKEMHILINREQFVRQRSRSSSAPVAVHIAEFLYCICRITASETVVETGVALGLSLAYMLLTMEETGRDTLYSLGI